MTVNDLVNLDGFKALALPDGDREITGVYIGDLLSWVMGKASSGDAWITIMSNMNIIAVATLADTSCIIVAEGVALDKELIDTAIAKDVNILSSQKSIYETAVDLSGLI